MCNKHDACRTQKINAIRPVGTSCSAPTIAAISSTEETSSSCCSTQGECSASEPEEPLVSGESLETNASMHSWKVIGMDCPSCARKVETAMSKIPGVVSAKVLFATEKLVVRVNDPALVSEVESAVLKVGFTLQSLNGSSSSHTAQQPMPSGWRKTVSENAHILAISAGMLIAALSRSSFPQLSEWLFVLTCLLGLIPITKKAFQLAKSGTPFAIETLMSVAAIGALYLGETVEAGMVLLLFLIGERLESFAASKARSGVQALMSLVPEDATVVIDGVRSKKSASELQPGDMIEVAPGDRLPADGELVSTSASFDESALTGESLPVERLVGDNVMAGAVLTDKVVILKVTSKQGENAIDRILHLIEEAESRKAPIERFLDKFSRWYTPLMMLVSLAVIITPPLLFAQPWETWVYRGLALLLIACPCALVISTPAAITSGLAAATRRGALIKGGAALEQLGNVKAIAFDKTGTLTLGRPHVTDIMPLADFDQEYVLQVSAAIESGSHHPLAISLVRYVEEQGISIPEATEKRALVGIGIEGIVAGHHYALLAPSKVVFELKAETLAHIASLEDQGKTVVVLTNEGRAVGLIAWRDEVRADAAEAVQKLAKLGINTIMLTGDNARSAHAIATPLGMDYKASLLPADKVTYVNELAQHQRVAMVGDGINDAPAMKAANIGIAMGGGTDVALETADAALTHNRLAELPVMVELSRATLNNIKQNVTLALGLKAVFLVTTLLGMTGLWVAVLADSGATAIVTLNALRLLRHKSKLD
ncbi:zinc/cadmium/mercury/lead-transporting ATPase [Vibrio methylphosphonaticus]|uniref:zinc/cadmium/mercury/lead-transporting ATPase n=1 Tax=Vibrio methylphosphonaticus TaxID=2946866 RepID=UPI002029F7E0|nr:zinc/cadmium/mercury/lead-transporting ATPase [Vibrio methylphosphonaticus]MCL9774646.1 zinc/cadmium/mercury/lead-transporting ATPase [Vibrio methylphosphonaticus]